MYSDYEDALEEKELSVENAQGEPKGELASEPEPNGVIGDCSKRL